MMFENLPIPIIIVTHNIQKNFIIKAINQIEKLDFVLEKIIVMTIDKNYK